MRVIIAGSRTGFSLGDVEQAFVFSGWALPLTVISGTARGVDVLGETWAYLNKITLEKYPAQWDLYGKRAGYIRNEEMANKADALIALWDLKSRGTLNMIKVAHYKNLPTIIWSIKGKGYRNKKSF